MAEEETPKLEECPTTPGKALLETVVEKEEEPEGVTLKMQTGCGNLYVTINKYKGPPKKYEIHIVMGKSGGCTASNLEAIGNLSNLAFEKGASLDDVFKTLKGIRCPSPHLSREGMTYSCADVVAKALKHYSSAHPDDA